MTKIRKTPVMGLARSAHRMRAGGKGRFNMLLKTGKFHQMERLPKAKSKALVHARSRSDSHSVREAVTVLAEADTAIALIDEVATIGRATYLASKKEQHRDALRSDDMWFGDPKDMPAEDLAFFGLEK